MPLHEWYHNGEVVPSVGFFVGAPGADRLRVFIRDYGAGAETNSYDEFEVCKHFESTRKLPKHGMPFIEVERFHLICPQCFVSGRFENRKVASTSGMFITDVQRRFKSAGFPIRDFGIEVEVGYNREKRVSRDGYHSRIAARRPFLADWRHEFDRSIDPFNGVEYISPAFHSAKYALASMAYTSATLLRRGASADPAYMGIHVHIARHDDHLHRLAIAVTSLEELFYAIGNGAHRYASSRYCIPMKSSVDLGHYQDLHVSSSTYEFRMFGSSTEIVDWLIAVAMAQAVVAIHEDNRLIVDANPNRYLDELVVEQWSVFQSIADWRKGGRWIGWLYNPDSSAAVTVHFNHRKTPLRFTLPESEEILGRINKNIVGFVKKFGHAKIKDILGGDA